MWHREFFRWLDTWLKPGSEAAKAYIAQQDSIAKARVEKAFGEPTPMPKTQENLNITNPDLKAYFDKAKAAKSEAPKEE